MSLVASFTHPVADAQHAFRRILKAMSEPGTVVCLPALPAWAPLSNAATAVLTTLVDRETPLWLDSTLKQEALLQNLRFHTGAIVTHHTDAPFALLAQDSVQPLAAFFVGDNLSPEKSTTVIVELPALQGGAPLRLRGPGIETHRDIAPVLPPAIQAWLPTRASVFPQGIDLMFTCGSELLALPRTTLVEAR